MWCEMVEAPFEGYSKKIKTIVIDGKELLIKPKLRDSEAFMLVTKEMNADNVRKISDILVNMVTRAYVEQGKEVVKEDIEDYIAENYGEFFYQSAVFFGFMSKEEMEAVKKKVMQDQTKGQ